MSLIGTVYIQPTDPGAVGYGYQWANSSTGNVYDRNTSNTAWVFQRNSNQAQGGALPVSGGAMTGAITGASGFAPISSPAFTGSPNVAGVNLVTQTVLTNSLAALTTTLNNDIASAIASVTGTFNINGQLAIKSGTVSDGGTIPLPNYGGTNPRQATISEVMALMVGPETYTYQTDGNASHRVFTCTASGALVVTCNEPITAGGGGSSQGTVAGASVANYLIICLRVGN